MWYHTGGHVTCVEGGNIPYKGVIHKHRHTEHEGYAEDPLKNGFRTRCGDDFLHCLVVAFTDREDGQTRVVLPLILPHPTQARNSGRVKQCWIAGVAGCHGGGGLVAAGGMRL